MQNFQPNSFLFAINVHCFILLSVDLNLGHKVSGKNTCYFSSEPGIRRGNEDSRRHENRKSQKNKLTSIFFFFFFKQPVAVAESMEITMLVASKVDRGPLMELSFVDICIFQTISVTAVYSRS